MLKPSFHKLGALKVSSAAMFEDICHIIQNNWKKSTFFKNSINPEIWYFFKIVEPITCWINWNVKEENPYRLCWASHNLSSSVKLLTADYLKLLNFKWFFSFSLWWYKINNAITVDKTSNLNLTGSIGTSVRHNWTKSIIIFLNMKHHKPYSIFTEW